MASSQPNFRQIERESVVKKMVVREEGGWRPVRINVRNLINDFLEMYSSEPEEVVVTESIANSLDARPTKIEIALRQSEDHDVYSIADNGRGMSESAFESSYHALALSTKTKGESIGFAGVGGKLYLAMLEAGHSIYTETRSARFSGASELGMNGDEAVWRKVEPRGNLRTNVGTYVEVKLRRGKLSRRRIEEIICENYNAVLSGMYGKIAFRLSWKRAKLQSWTPAHENFEQRRFNVDGRRCTAYLWLTKEDFSNPKGLDIVVLGKKVKGDQWFNLQFDVKPQFSRRIYGMVKADVLARLLTTNKQELKTSNDRTWHSFRRQIYAVFKQRLAEVGAVEFSQPQKTTDEAATKEVTHVVNSILKLPDFTNYNPHLKRILPGSTAERRGEERRQTIMAVGSGSASTSQSVENLAEVSASSREAESRRGGVRVSLAKRPDSEEEAWIDSDAIVINSGHPVFQKSQEHGNAMETMHMMRCIFMALMENQDPAKKDVFDELRRFFKGWAKLNRG